MEGRLCRFLVEERRVCAVAADHPDVADGIDRSRSSACPPDVPMGLGRQALLAVPDQELRVL